MTDLDRINAAIEKVLDTISNAGDRLLWFERSLERIQKDTAALIQSKMVLHD